MRLGAQKDIENQFALRRAFVPGLFEMGEEDGLFFGHLRARFNGRLLQSLPPCQAVTYEFYCVFRVALDSSIGLAHCKNNVWRRQFALRVKRQR